MAGRVALVLPSPGLRAAASQLLAETGEDALVYTGAEFHPERVVSRALEEGAAVIIAPPPLARGLRQVGLLPVVEVEATPFELLEALLRAREGGRPVVLVHYSRTGPDAEVLSRLAGVPVTCLCLPRDAGKVREQLEKVPPESVVVGGETTASVAAGLGLAAVAVTPGKAALEEALKRARAVLAALGQGTAAAAAERGWGGAAGGRGGGGGACGGGDGVTGAQQVGAGATGESREQLRAPWEEVVAVSPAMNRTAALARQIAGSLRPALVWGELGVGKSFLCGYIHRLGPLADQEMLVVPCGGGPQALKERLEKVLDRGSGFQGTLVLEEVEELPPEWQAVLVRLLDQEGCGIRVLATTRGKLKEAVDGGRFREDLYWRLSELQLRVPPLRERTEDLEPLLGVFWTELAGQPLPLTAAGKERLLRYHWPGNVRELRNFAHRYYLIWKGLPLSPPEEKEKMALDDFLSAVEEESLRAPIQVVPGTLESMQAQIMREMTRRIKGSKAEVARRLGISRTTLWKRLKEAGRVSAGGEGIS